MSNGICLYNLLILKKEHALISKLRKSDPYAAIKPRRSIRISTLWKFILIEKPSIKISSFCFVVKPLYDKKELTF